MNIYLDIDGVLLAHENRAADYADEFLQFILKYWPETTYWLTTHCWKGHNRTYDVLEPYLRKQTLKQLHLIKPTEWGELKTDAINFKRPFLWFDDDLFDEEKQILEHYRALECHRRIDLGHDQFQLLDEIVHLRSLV